MQNAPIKIQQLSHDGRGIASLNGKKLFIFGALPEEIVTYHIIRKHRNYDEAVATEIQQTSPLRITAKCPHFGTCGGCVLQHLNTEEQLKFKQSVLLEHLTHFANTKPEKILPPLHAQSWGYRRRARLSVRHVIKKNKVLVGFHELDGRYVADLNICEVLHPNIGKHLTDLSDLLQKLSNPAAIVQIEVAISETDQALVLRNIDHLTEADRNLLIYFGKTFSFTIYLESNNATSLEKIYSHKEIPLSYSLPHFNLQYQFQPQDFVQINFDINRLMVNQALQLLQPSAEDHILDFFCGAGNFTLPLAKNAKQVIGIEGDRILIDKANQNAQNNQISNVSFEVVNLAKADSVEALQHRLRSFKANKVLLDPPRSGADILIPALIALKPKKILYISCNPATLSRDAKILCDNSYQLTQAGIMDMFPQTKHVEAMALFELKAH